MNDMTRLTEDAALEHVSGVCFKTGPPRRVGVELEWFPRDTRDPERLPAADHLLKAFDKAADLPLDGALSIEPGGQWELSSRPAETVQDLIAVTDRDMALLRDSAEEDGLRLVGTGHESQHPPRRILDSPRYTAMEEYFDRDGPWGRAMMCSTASIQINLDAGTDDDGPSGFRHRWRLAHLLQPVLAAAFGRSSRRDVWARLDPSRTLPPPLDTPDPRLAYAHYALDARLLCVRQPDGVPWTAPRDTTFRDWLRADGPRPVTLEDLDYHLTTLFPPVRARGHFELRTIDALPRDLWHVPVAFVAGLFDDPLAADQAMTELGARRTPHAPLRNAVAACFDIAGTALSRSGAPRSLREEVTRYAEEEISWN
jgi:glutamate--cysteine ligase